jgi:DNA-binding transcriptional ArsR family regulator
VGTRSVERVFDALGDPGRRALVASIADRGTATATELAADLPVTRQAVAKQLVALAEAGLVRATRVGREARYEVSPEPLRAAASWLVEVGAQWDQRLAALERSLIKARAARRSS